MDTLTVDLSTGAGLDLLAGRVRRLATAGGEAGETAILGITGPPGAGKTTLVLALLERLRVTEPPDVESRFAHVPMDGFHLSDRELARLGLLARKGAPETFDVYGYAELLRRLAGHRQNVVYAPGFERVLEQPVAGDIPVYPGARTVLTEGNYLLLDSPGWKEVRSRCTEVWYCDQPDDVRLDRLTRRHVDFGKEPDAAAAWVAGVDQPNALLVQQSRSRADLVVTVS